MSALLIAGVLTCAAAVAQTPPLPPGLGVRLLDVTAARSDDPRAHRYIVDHVAPGAAFERRFEVSNGTDESASVNLYAAAAQLLDGEFIPDGGRGGNELTSWVTLHPQHLDLPPGGSAPVTVTITVPPDAAAGERYALALAELPPSAPGADQLDVVVRAGIRIYLSVGPGGEPPSDFAIDSVTVRRQGDRRPVVAASVRNTGARALDLAGEVNLNNGPGRLSAGPFPVATQVTLAPGASGTVTAVLDAVVPDGPWDARVVLRSGTLEREAGARVTFPAVGAGGLTIPATTVAPDRPPTPLLLSAVLLIVLTAATVTFVAGERREREAEPVG